MSDGDEDDIKDKINSPKFANRTTKCVNNGKRLYNGDAKVLRSKCPDFICALMVTLITFTKIMNDF